MSRTTAGRRAPPRLFIAGAWRDASNGRTLRNEHPATAEPIVDVAFAEERDIDAAVSAARLAHLEALDVGTRAPSGSTHAIRLGRHGG